VEFTIEVSALIRTGTKTKKYTLMSVSIPKYALRAVHPEEWPFAEEKRRRAGIIRYYNQTELTGFFAFREWPEWARLILLKHDKHRSERYQLWYFLYRNGASPILRRHAVLCLNIPAPFIDEGMPIEQLLASYPIEAGRAAHVDEMEKQAREGYFENRGGSWYDLVYQRVFELSAHGPKAVKVALSKNKWGDNN